MKLQRMFGLFPKPIEQQLVLEDRDGLATDESVKQRVNKWIMMNSTGRPDIGTTRKGGDNQDNEGGELGSSEDLTGLKGGKKLAGKGQCNGDFYQCGHWRHGKEL